MIRYTLTNPAQTIAFLAKRRSLALGFDLETTGFNVRKDKIRTMAFSDGENSIVLDCFQHENWSLVLDKLHLNTLIAHNAKFDLKWLWHHGVRPLPPTWDTMIASRLINAGIPWAGNNLQQVVARYLDIQLPKEVNHSQWKRPGKLSEEQLKYIVEDVIYLPPLMRKLGEKLVDVGLTETYKLELMALPAFIWMEYQGVRVDPERWKAITEKNIQKNVELTDKLIEIVHPQTMAPTLFNGFSPINWNSPKQVKEIFNDMGILDASGHKITSTGDAVLASIDHPLAVTLRKYREVNKAISSYGQEWLRFIEDNDRIYPTWIQLGADTGRTSCKDPNCYDGSTEILTPEGWIPLERYDASQPVLQAKPTGSLLALEWVPIKQKVQYNTMDWILLESDHMDLQVTPNHRMLVIGSRLEETTAEDYDPSQRGYNIHAGEWNQGKDHLFEDFDKEDSLSWDAVIAAFMVAIQADGHFRSERKKYVEVNLAKERKNKELLSLLNTLNTNKKTQIIYDHGVDASGKFRFAFSPSPLLDRIVELLGEEKSFGPWILKTSVRFRQAICDSLPYWDGLSTRTESGLNELHTENQQNAEWLQIALALCGFKTTLRKYGKKGRPYYLIRWTENVYSPCSRVRKRSIKKHDTAYCVTVPSGWLLVRRNGKIVVSGNCQQVPRDPLYRDSFIPDEGCVMIKSDVSQFQLRIAAQISRDKEMMRAYLSGSDLHTRTAQRVLGKTEVTKADRQIAKSLNFGLLFGMGAEGLQRFAKQEYGMNFTLDEAAEHRKQFFRIYPGLLKWHRETMRSMEIYTRTRIGRRRILQDKLPITIKLNTPVQGDEADGMKRSLAFLYMDYQKWHDKAWPVLMIHDEIVLEAKEEYAEEASQWLVDCMTKGIQPTLDPIPAIVDASIRPSWATPQSKETFNATLNR